MKTITSTVNVHIKDAELLCSLINYKVYCHQYNEDSWSQGDYHTHCIATCSTKELAEEIAKYEHELSVYNEDYFKYNSGYESVYYTVEVYIKQPVLNTIEEYYQSKES